jgi:hypothetical protein
LCCLACTVATSGFHSPPGNSGPFGLDRKSKPFPSQPATNVGRTRALLHWHRETACASIIRTTACCAAPTAQTTGSVAICCHRKPFHFRGGASATQDFRRHFRNRDSTHSAEERVPRLSAQDLLTGYKKPALATFLSSIGSSSSSTLLSLARYHLGAFDESTTCGPAHSRSK